MQCYSSEWKAKTSLLTKQSQFAFGTTCEGREGEEIKKKNRTSLWEDAKRETGIKPH